MKYLFTLICLVVLGFAGYQVVSQTQGATTTTTLDITPSFSSEDQEVLAIKQSLSEETGDMSEDEVRVSVTGNQDIDPIKLEQKKGVFEKKGDFYTYKQFDDSALESYQIAFVLSNKEDLQIAQKIANIHFEKRNYELAVRHYKIAASILTDEEYEMFIRSLFYSQDAELVKYIQEFEVGNSIMEEIEVFNACQESIAKCRDHIVTYQESDSIGMLPEKLLATYNQYNALGSDDVYYLMALIVAQLVESEAYMPAVTISTHILDKRPDYLSVLKLGGYSAYNLGMIDEANELLQKYNEKNNEDAQVLNLLGNIYSEQQDLTTSNLYLNQAKDNGYSPLNELQRKLAYNYYLLDLEKNMIYTLHDLLMSDDAILEDYTNGIYIAVESGNYQRYASKWLEKALDIYPESSDLVALGGKILQQEGQLENAISVYKQAITLDRKNALAMFQLGTVFLEQENYIDAQRYFSKTSLYDNGGMFASQVDIYLTQILEICEAGGCNETVDIVTSDIGENDS